MVHSYSVQDNAKDQFIFQLQEQLNQWKVKYEALAKMYAQLRQDHLDLLQKTKEFSKFNLPDLQNELKQTKDQLKVVLR